MNDKNEIIEQRIIQDSILTIRGIQIMLDRDLAELYQVKAIRLREQVKRNKERFPDKFMFQLTKEEVDLLVSQNAIPSKKHLGGHLPFAFTEQGIAMLSAVLRSEVSIKVSIQIMNTFVQMRKFFLENAQVFQRLESLENRQMLFQNQTDNKFEQVFDALQDRELKPKQGVFYEGQIFDAYVFVSDIIKSAKDSIVLIDNYIDETVLLMLAKRNKNCEALIYTRNISKQLKLDLEKYNAQYPRIQLKTFTSSHDRFLIIDGKSVYHIGASLKDSGKKWFAFSKLDMDAQDILEKLK